MKKSEIFKNTSKSTLESATALKSKISRALVIDNQLYNVKLVAETDTDYITSDNKTISKDIVNSANERKNTIDYRYNEVDDMKYNQLQKNLCRLLKISTESDMRVCRRLFDVVELTKSVAIIATDSTVLNRANCFEIMLSEHDFNAIKNSELATKAIESKVRSRENRLDTIAFDEGKYKNRIKTSDTYGIIHSIILQTTDEIKTFNELINQ